MAHKANKYLYDMINACDKIDQFTQDKTIEEYVDDSLLRAGVRYEFMIIGEALQQLYNRFPDIAQGITEHRSIINFRNLIVHGYDEVDDPTVWNIIKSKLPILKNELEAIMVTLQ